MWKFIIAGSIAAVCAAPLAAQNVAVSLQSAVFVERLGHTGDGRVQHKIEPATTLKRGDRVILMVEWSAAPSRGGFAVTSAIPTAISYQDASDDKAQVSVDGGRHWGRLGALRVGGRYATPEDVTHLRWQIGGLDARRGSGRMTYSAIVR